MTIDLEELERLAKAATPGPWRVKDGLVAEHYSEDWIRAANGVDVATVRHPHRDDADSNFIAAANPDVVQALVAHIRELERRLATETQWGPKHD